MCFSSKVRPRYARIGFGVTLLARSLTCSIASSTTIPRRPHRHHAGPHVGRPAPQIGTIPSFSPVAGWLFFTQPTPWWRWRWRWWWRYRKWCLFVPRSARLYRCLPRRTRRFSSAGGGHLAGLVSLPQRHDFVGFVSPHNPDMLSVSPQDEEHEGHHQNQDRKACDNSQDQTEGIALSIIVTAVGRDLHCYDRCWARACCGWYVWCGGG